MSAVNTLLGDDRLDREVETAADFFLPRTRPGHRVQADQGDRDSVLIRPNPSSFGMMLVPDQNGKAPSAYGVSTSR